MPRWPWRWRRGSTIQTLETQRLTLRGFALDDLDDLFAYAQSPKVGPMAGWSPHSDREASRAILSSFIEKDEVWAVVWKENSRVIGSVGLHPDTGRSAPNVKMLGYVLGEDYWGKGLMPEAVQAILRFAFEEMELALVSVGHYPFNTQSKRVIEKCGFRLEGTLRHAVVGHDGTVYDSVRYAMLKSEFLCRYGR